MKLILFHCCLVLKLTMYVFFIAIIPTILVHKDNLQLHFGPCYADRFIFIMKGQLQAIK